MLKITNREQLVEVLTNLDCVEYSTIKIANTTIELFCCADKIVVFDNCEWQFNTLDEVENYIASEYGLQ